LSSNVTITLVPAQHYSARTLWDKNQSLWGGFVISGPSGNVFYSGDTGYGPHFQEIARRFSPIRAALLPIAPFRPSQAGDPTQGYRRIIHMGPADAVQAHLDLGTLVSIAAHYQVFQLGFDGFNDAVDELVASLKEHHLKPDAFVAPTFGQTIHIPPTEDASLLLVALAERSIGWKLFDSLPLQDGYSEKIIPLTDMLSAQSLPSPESAVW
jgi:L-ascorbate metabolism protein UlaG (beta-lactamase superfamily)